MTTNTEIPDNPAPPPPGVDVQPVLAELGRQIANLTADKIVANLNAEAQAQYAAGLLEINAQLRAEVARLNAAATAPVASPKKAPAHE